MTNGTPWGEQAPATSNAILLLGYVSALLIQRGKEDYEVIDVDADRGEISVRSWRGNLFTLSVKQIGEVQ